MSTNAIKNLPTPISPEWGIWHPRGGGFWLFHSGYRGDGPVAFEDKDQAVMSAIAEYDSGCLCETDSGPVIVCRFTADLSDAVVVHGETVTDYAEYQGGQNKEQV